MPAPDGWTKTFTDPRLCAAIVDRLTFNATIIETGTESYRLARAKAGTAKPVSRVIEDSSTRAAHLRRGIFVDNPRR